MKLQDARKDYYRKLAKERGYKSRAAFKLLDSQKRYNLIRRGDRVIDFGAAPGGWVQVASEAVGESGIVVAVDLFPIELNLSNARLIQSDIQDTNILEKVRVFIPGKADVFLSDIAPQVSGAWDLDHYRQVELTVTVMKLAEELLKRGGNAVLKVFEGERFKEVKDLLEANFRFVAVTKPKASRMKSSELYIVCLGYKLS